MPKTTRTEIAFREYHDNVLVREWVDRKRVHYTAKGEAKFNHLGQWRTLTTDENGKHSYDFRVRKAKAIHPH